MITIDLDTVESTNATAKALAEEHAHRPLTVVAAEQTGGRGRRGRSWRSPRGGVWMTIARPVRAGEAHTDAIALVAGLAVRDAIAEDIQDRGITSAYDLTIKWPNDILLDDNKVAGILCERTVVPSVNDETEHRTETLLVGIGINADFDENELPDDARHPATTLRSRFRTTFSARELAERVVRRFTALGDEIGNGAEASLPQHLLSRLNEALAYAGEPVSFTLDREQREGVVRGVDKTGALIVETDTATIAVTSGEVDRLRANPVCTNRQEA